MNSVEKVRAYVAGAGASSDEQNARTRLMLRAIGPMALQQLPDDPAELDVWLCRGALFCLGMRSDDAPTLETIEQLLVAGMIESDETAEPAA